MKHLVTVLLQETVEWPSSVLLIAAINHPELLDRAVWRSCEMIVPFPMPGEEQIKEAVLRHRASCKNPKVKIHFASIKRGQAF